MKKFLLFIVSIFLLLPNASAAQYQNYGVTSQEQQLIESEKKSERNFFEDLRYRFVEKDTHDAYDYTLIIIIIALMLLIIIMLNKRTYVTIKEESVFEEETK